MEWFVNDIKRWKYDKKEDETNGFDIIYIFKLFQEKNKTYHGEVGELYENSSVTIIILFSENNNKHSVYDIYVDHENGCGIDVDFNEVDLERNLAFDGSCHLNLKHSFQMNRKDGVNDINNANKKKGCRFVLKRQDCGVPLFRIIKTIKNKEEYTKNK